MSKVQYFSFFFLNYFEPKFTLANFKVLLNRITICVLNVKQFYYIFFQWENILVYIELTSLRPSQCTDVWVKEAIS